MRTTEKLCVCETVRLSGVTIPPVSWDPGGRTVHRSSCRFRKLRPKAAAQYIRCLNNQAATVRLTAPMSPIGQYCPIKLP